MQNPKIPKPRKNIYPAETKTLEVMVRKLVEVYGWERLGEKIYIRCFNENPSLKSSLKFLRDTEWARLEVEALFNWRENTGWNPDDDHK